MVKVSEIMRKYVITVGPNISVSDAAKIMARNKVGSVLIVENSSPIGILTSDDITALVAKGKPPGKTKLSVFKKKMVTASPEDSVIQVTKTMVKNGIKRVPVLKEGHLVGIVTDKEVLISMPEMLEVLSERLKASVSVVAPKGVEISGIDEETGDYSDDLIHVNGRWISRETAEREG